ncbi:MAG TPA: aldehyde dehydrogenase family protein [Streptosporangiaceae bacterium]|nr:aldehyde dehydrogenase family protein [Streptosporangiaceae bacterium]
MSVFTVLNPATEEPVTTVDQASSEQADEAIARAAAASPAWRAVAPGDRARLLRAFAASVDSHLEELAGLEVTGSGHPVGAARWEAGQVRDVLLYYSAAPERLIGQQIPVAGGLNVTFHEPLGVVGLIVPWNFPMPILSWGMAPALAAGNTVVAKPAEATPLTAMRIGELALEAGLPEGVFTVLAGKGSVVGQRLVDHPAVRKIVFTGSTEVGQQIMTGCARQIKRLTLELGGKSANIIFADCDLERAAATAPYAVFDNAGQDCCARSRILVQRSVLDRFMALFEPAVQGVAVGDPASAATEMGPLISAAHRSHVASFVPPDAPVAFRGSAPSGKGFWYPPTVLAPVRPDDPAYTEEVFGPVVTVTPFEDEAEAIAIANDTPYGLSGSIWTSDVGRAIRVARAVETGNLSVNSHSSVRYWTPFGGFKQSGLGRELGPDAPDAFTETKNVFISTEGR